MDQTGKKENPNLKYPSTSRTHMTRSHLPIMQSNNSPSAALSRAGQNGPHMNNPWPERSERWPADSGVEARRLWGFRGSSSRGRGC